jgi:hypothetical protein
MEHECPMSYEAGKLGARAVKPKIASAISIFPQEPPSPAVRQPYREAAGIGASWQLITVLRRSRGNG